MADRLDAAFRGRSLWTRLNREFGAAGRDCVVLLPEDDQELNESALRHIDELAERTKERDVIIVSDQRWVIENAKRFSERILSVVSAAQSEIDDLISFYELYAFTERLYIISLTKPHGNKLKNMLCLHDVTKEDLAASMLGTNRTAIVLTTS